MLRGHKMYVLPFRVGITHLYVYEIPFKINWNFVRFYFCVTILLPPLNIDIKISLVCIARKCYVLKR